jgi:hypothetical protein
MELLREDAAVFSPRNIRMLDDITRKRLDFIDTINPVKRSVASYR